MPKPLLDIFFRIAFAAMIVFALSSGLGASELSLKEVFLRPQITVEKPEVTLGDVFTNTGEAASVVVTAAPDPGEELNLSALALGAFARRNGLNWANIEQAAQVTVGRPGRTVTMDDILPALEQALVDAGAPAENEAQVSDPALKITVAAKAETAFEIQNLDYDARTGSFSADIRFPAAAGANGQLRPVQGRVYAVRDVPVLATTVESGQHIARSDITWKKFRLPQISRAVIGEEDGLIGMEARRRLAPGRPITASDVQKPLVVSRGKLVVISYRKPGLSLSVEGRALEQGGINDTIRVMNTRSNRTVIASIVGPSEVLVTSGSALPGDNPASN